MTQNHIIKKQILDLTLESGTGAFTIQGRFGEIFKTEIAPLLDACLSEMSVAEETVRIDKLEIDLGMLRRGALTQDFKRKINFMFPESLAKAMKSAVYFRALDLDGADGSNGDYASSSTVSGEAREFELLEFFLKNGRLPWWVKDGEFYDIPRLLELYLTVAPLKIKNIVAGGAASNSLWPRLVYQAGDELLEKIMALFQPQSYQVIGKLAGELMTVLAGCPLIAPPEPTLIRREVWSCMLALAVEFEGEIFKPVIWAQTVARRISKIADADYAVLFEYLAEKMKLERDGTVSQTVPSSGPGHAGYTVDATGEYELLESFLKNGRLPYGAKAGKTYDIPALLELSLATHPEKLKILIREIAADDARLKRLTFQAGDQVLEKITALFQPQNYQAIDKLAGELITVLEGCPLVAPSGPALIGREVRSCMLALAVEFEGEIFKPVIWAQTVARRISKIANADYDALCDYLVKTILHGEFPLSGGLLLARIPRESGLAGEPLSPGIGNIEEAKGIEVANRPLFQGSLEIETKEDDIAGVMLSPEFLDIKTSKTGAWVQASSPGNVDIEAEKIALPGELEIIEEMIASGITDRKTGAYLRQLDTAANRLQELQRILSNRIALSKAEDSAEPGLVRLTGKLPRIFESMQDICGMMLELLKKAGELSRLTQKPPGPDEELKRRTTRLEADVDGLCRDLAAVFNRDDFAAHREFIKKTVKSLELIKEIKEKALQPEPPSRINTFADSEEIFIANAGLVILWPYLPRFFELIGLTVDGCFNDETGKERAVFLLQYLARGCRKAPEYELMLNKILCGVDLDTPVKLSPEITEKEKEEAENLLQAVILNWPVLKNVSTMGLRDMFLNREGMVSDRDGVWVLRVAEQAYDILLDRMPWGIGTLKLPWMRKLLFVEWRL